MLLLAQAHNAEQLENYCYRYIVMNEQDLIACGAFDEFTSKSDPQLYSAILAKIKGLSEKFYIQICIE